MVQMISMQSCDPDWFACQAIPYQYPPIQFDGNRSTLETARGWLEQALTWQPASDMVRLHLAEALFAQGERETAARLVGEMSRKDGLQSPLLQMDRYQARLIQAYHAMEQKDWDEAITISGLV